MKRFAILAIMAAFILGTVAMASAVELKARGAWRAHANWTDNLNYQDADNTDGDGQSEDDFNVQERARVWFDFIANENVKAVLGLEIGNFRWGQPGAGDLSTDNTGIIKVKHAYLDFNLPETQINVKAGLQRVALPSAFGSNIFDGDVAALVTTVPVNEMVSVVTGWARPYDRFDGENNSRNDETDIAFLVVPVKLDGVALNPFFAYAWIGKDSYLPANKEDWVYSNIGFDFDSNGAANGSLTDDATAWWAGLNFKVTMFDPIVIDGDINYGRVDGEVNVGGGDKEDLEISGWFFDLAASYKMDMMTPQVFFVYSTGLDDDSLDSGDKLKMNWFPVYYTESFAPTTFGFAGSSFTYDNQIGAYASGLWAVGFALRDIKLVDKLSHEFIVMYARGTNDKNCIKELSLSADTLTEKDSLWEVDFNTKYQMYENLAAIVELGYIKANYDEDVKVDATDKRGDNFADEAAWKLSVGVTYNF
ncbi:MAG: Uncharacterized protein XD41_1311 [Desulfonauticus sp. 38_4375]|nr:MAG: Uncharacterized protein XD41_1311 [Desulfonauticus sp. 38_4375]